MSEKPDVKAVSRSVTLREDFWDQVDAHAKQVTGDRSTYIRGLIERDLSGAPALPDVSDERFLEHLYTALLPSRAARFRRIWESRTRLGTGPGAQAELVEAFLCALLRNLEAEPSTQILDAFDALPAATLDAIVQAATTGDTAALEADPNIIHYTQIDESAKHVAEDPPPATRTGRILPKQKPPKPPSTGTTP